MNLYIVCLIIFVMFFLGTWFNRRQDRLLREENEVRERLGLPQLTPSQFSIKVVEKSEEYRSNINQHM